MDQLCLIVIIGFCFYGLCNHTSKVNTVIKKNNNKIITIGGVYFTEKIVQLPKNLFIYI